MLHVNELQSAHDGWDNYYHEPQYAKEIISFFVTAEDIPKEIERKIIDIFLDCRIGREVRYNLGVSPSAKEYYNEFFKMLNKEQIIMTIRPDEEAFRWHLFRKMVFKHRTQKKLLN